MCNSQSTVKHSLVHLAKLAVGIPLLLLRRYGQTAAYFVERQALLRRFGRCEPDLALAPPWDIRGEAYIFIGRDVFIGPQVLLIADKDAEIHIGDKVMFGPQVKLIANDHRFDDPTRAIKDSGYKPVTGISVGNDVWIGAGAIILKDVRIGDGAVVGAGAVVTADIGSCEVWAGNPARKIKDRFEVCRSS